ncbi:sensor histidine kinase [Devosia aurantiaca]|uniref:histidine kinase n=1 Tax=Devosia aurantiaca TaxID=2714858 RepID=A0A6M1SAZ7_9HYPH|nr:HAMP domain-containing sensor histidine kinase [Devosia aurantiaca]NGP17119.1 HAMP domain-containing histidine kinase [Devosia aurantiaca]
MTRRFLVALVAMGILFALLIAASVRLLQSETRTVHYISEDMVWLSSQGQYEAIRYADALSSFARGQATIDEPQLRLDLLSSRITVLEDGETYRQMEALGYADELVEFRTIVDDAVGRMVGLQPSHVAEISALHREAQALAADLRDVANAAMFAKRDRDRETRDERRHTLFEVLGTLVATMAAGLLMAAVLVRDHRNMVSAESALERERQVSRLHRAFISVVSHQFRTPLAIIDASAQRMIRRGAQMDVAEIVQRADKIRAACLRLTRLMESTLNAARLEEGEITLNIRGCDPVALLRNVIDGQPEQDQKRIELRMENVPGWIEADLTLIEQAVQNLVSNALKYSTDGQPVVIMARRQGSDILISVTDKGVGIPADEMEQLFRRFFRARTSEGIPGTGIGLSFVSQIMELHHGKVEVRSVEGQGSTFTLRMPITQPVPETGTKLSFLPAAATAPS